MSKGLGKSFVISIHAPTWGATSKDRLSLFRYCDFNPRTHVGCDYLEPTELKGFGISIHAPTWGATSLDNFQKELTNISIHAPTWGATKIYDDWYRDSHFNPRTHVGCDNNCSSLRHLCFISIHAPTWGATNDWYRDSRIQQISIHAPTWGATVDIYNRSVYQQFQSTHPRGVRRSCQPP